MLSPRRNLAAIVACVAAAFVVTTAATRSTDGSRSSREIARLRAHFDSVLHELRSANVSTLAPAQRAARETLIGRLEQYAAAGRFPHNHVRPGQFVPVFRDEHGTLCAMAYLIASTGRSDIVDDIERSNNLAYIPELAGDARLRAWLDSTGLTAAEAARIQPQYDGGICLCPRGGEPEPQPGVAAAARREYMMGSAFASTVNGAALYFNIASRSAGAGRTRATTALGLVAGTAQVVLGSLALSQSDSRRTVGVANMAIGGGSIGASVWRMMHPPRKSVAAVSVTVQPYVNTTRGAGLLLSTRM